jgi:polysaccharide pyruvyl transferase CsaB
LEAPHVQNATSRESLRIGIYGSYGGFNLGDEAILQSIIHEIRSHLRAEITVFTRDPEDTLARHRVERAVGSWAMSREEVRPEVERLDFFILGGGGILYDADARTYMREPWIALEKQIPVMVYAVGAGPLEDIAVRSSVRTFLHHASLVTVRDRNARRLFEEIGVKREILLTADPAFRLEPLPKKQSIHSVLSINADRIVIGMSVREAGRAAPDIHEEVYHAILANSADFMIERYGAFVVFIPMERKARDLQQSHAVIARMLRAEYATVLRGDYSPDELLSLIGQFSFCVGMRLHFLLFSALQGVPFVGLPYSSKVLSFLEEMHMVVPPLQLVDAGRLIAYIDRAWDNRQEVTAHIRRTVPALRERAGTNIEQALHLLHNRYGNIPSLKTREVPSCHRYNTRTPESL